MNLFIAEKPDLAKAILSGIDGSLTSSEGYFQKGENIVTYAFGHILELCEPESYNPDYKIWNFADLPLKIENFKYKPKESSKKQLKIILDLIKDNKISKIINCGDADEEGQILIDEIINYSKTTKPIYRMLLKDITENGIRKSLKDIRPNSEFKGISDSGFARSLADWIVGMNLTRAYTLIAQQKGNKGVLSVGRVQTPILSLVVNRDKEHESHKSSFYYNITANMQVGNLIVPMRYKLKGDEKILDENIANSIKAKVENQSGNIIKTNNENKKEFAPLPYSLLLLQAECSKKFGYKPDKTLEITQNLREKHKAISYNRSDCQYLNENTFSECPEILNAVKNNLPILAEFVDNADTSIKHSCFNDKFVTAHTGIIPLANANVKNLNKDELNVYLLICKRFIALFYSPMEYIATSIEASVKDEIFIATSKTITKKGYKVLYSADDEDEENSNDDIKLNLTNIKENETAKANEVIVKKEQTKPKPYYTMATLLKDLASVAKYVKDEKIKKLLQEKDKDKKGENGGIGTPATRSAHIKNLLDRGFIAEKGKNIISTDLGRNLFDIAPQILTSVDMTALWFEEQKEISAGIKSKDDFLNSVKKVVADEIEKVKGKNMQNFANQQEEVLCPKCNNKLIRNESKKQKGKFYWFCSNYKGGCDLGFVNDKNGKPDFSEPKIDNTYKCPKCENGYLQKRNSTSKAGKAYIWFGCSEWRNGCDYKCFGDDKGEPKLS